MTKVTIRFEAQLTRADGSNSVFALAMPAHARAAINSSAPVMVEGVVNHFPFRAPLESGGMQISDAIRNAARAEAGDPVHVELTRIGDEPEVRVPADLQAALNTNAKAKAEWMETTPMARRDWVLSILVVRQEETRRGRVEKTIDMLAHGKGRVCCFPGLNWLTKDHVSKDETWQSLRR